MKDENDILYHASGLDLMLMLARLHKMGYGKLRWLSYISPNGCALRCHITTDDFICNGREVIWTDDKMLFATSVGSFEKSANTDILAQQFIDRFPRLADAGHGKDDRYEAWYKDLVRHARKGDVPEFYGDLFLAPLGKIIVGRKMYPAPPGTLRLISWNIDGMKAKWEDLHLLIQKHDPDILCLQKVKHQGDAPEFPGYRCFLSSAPYAGVCTYVKTNLVVMENDMFEHKPDLHGYLQKFSFIYPAFTLFNCYMPYSNPSVENAIEHRKVYDKQLISQVKSTPDRIVMCGDMNIVHDQIDCWDKKYKRNQANFHDWERRDFDKLMAKGNLVDTFRKMHPFDCSFSYFFRNDPEVRKKNQGHRIDYFLASLSFLPQISKADIINDITVSTNNPILLDLEY